MDTMEQFLKLLISVPYMTDEAIHSDDTDSRPHLILNTLKLYRPFHEQVFRLVREDFQQLLSDYKTAVSPNVARAIVVMALFAKEDSFVERVKLQWICSLLSRSDLPNYLREAICSFPISDLIDTQEELQQCFSLFETCCKSTPDPRVAIACTKAIDSLVPVAETVALDMLDTLLASLRDCIVHCTKLLTSYHSRKLEDLFSHLVMIVGSTLTENMTDDMDDWLLGVLNLILSADSSLHSYAFHLIGISIAFTFTKSMTAMVEPSFEYIMKTDLYRYVDLVEDGRRPSAEVFNAFIAIAIIQYGFSEIPEKRVYYLQRWDIRTLLNKVRYIPYLKNNSYTLLGSVVKYLGIDCLLTVEENAVDFMTRLCTDVYTEYFRNGCSIDTTINSMLWCLSIALSRTSPIFTCHELNTLSTCVPWKLFAKYLKASICDTVDDACFLTTAISTFLEIYPFERNAVVKYFHKISELFIICLVSFQDEDLYEIYRVISTLLPIIEDALVAGYSIHPEVVKASLDRLLGFLEEDEYDIQPLLARYERLKCIL